MLTLAIQEVAKSCNQIYMCESCDYVTSRKSSYNKHILTAKHKMRSIEGTCPHKCSCGKVFTRVDNLNRHKKTCMYLKNTTPKVAKVANCLPKVSPEHICECGRKYQHASSLSKHKKVCQHYISLCNENQTGSKVLDVLGTLKQDNAMLKDEIKQLKSGVMTAVSEPKIVNNNYNNNIIVFLNQKCGDAMAITDFASQIAMCLEDVDYALENGKVKGIENIIRKKFEELGTFKRPLHCTDVKRGTLYVKGDEGWEKEKGEVDKMIDDVECLQTRGIKVWEQSNPGFVDSDSRLMDKWLRIVRCLTYSIDGIGKKKIEKRCHEMCKINQDVMT